MAAVKQVTDQERSDTLSPVDSSIPCNTSALSQDDSPPEYFQNESFQDDEDEQASLLVKQVDVPPNKLPSYEMATSLPTYDDHQRMKESEAREQVLEMLFGNMDDKDEVYADGVVVGTDCMFVSAFILGFLFNWLGFFIGYCIFLNLAGRYGAMTGFGFSVVNWLICMRYVNHRQELATDEHLFMWWFFILFAFFLSLKGIANWLKARQLLTLSPEQRQNERIVLLY